MFHVKQSEKMLTKFIIKKRNFRSLITISNYRSIIRDRKSIGFDLFFIRLSGVGIKSYFSCTAVLHTDVLRIALFRYLIRAKAICLRPF